MRGEEGLLPLEAELGQANGDAGEAECYQIGQQVDRPRRGVNTLCCDPFYFGVLLLFFNASVCLEGKSLALSYNLPNSSWVFVARCAVLCAEAVVT